MKDPGKLPPANIRKIIHRYMPWIMTQLVNDIRKEPLSYRVGFTWRIIDSSPVVRFQRKYPFVYLEHQNLRWDIDDG